MFRHRLFGILGLVIVLCGALIPSIAALEVSTTVDIAQASGKCKQISVRYETSSSTTGVYALNWTLYKSESPVDSGKFESNRNISTTVDIPLNITLIDGGEYVISFEGEGEAARNKWFKAAACVSSSGVKNTDSSTSSTLAETAPCNLNDDRLDKSCAAPITTYVQSRDDGCYISIYSPYGRADGKTVFLLQATAAEIAAAQSQGKNAIIDSLDVVNLGSVTVYWLPATNEFQINAGPNAERKVYVLNFTGCPASNVYTTNSYRKSE